MNYETLLKNAPKHDTPEFLVYLMNNNTVVKMTTCWLIIENCKYHTPDQPWYTAFAMDNSNYVSAYSMEELFKNVPDGWCLMKKTEDKRTIGRLHYHLFPYKK